MLQRPLGDEVDLLTCLQSELFMNTTQAHIVPFALEANGRAIALGQDQRARSRRGPLNPHAHPVIKGLSGWVRSQARDGVIEMESRQPVCLARWGQLSPGGDQGHGPPNPARPPKSPPREHKRALMCSPCGAAQPHDGSPFSGKTKSRRTSTLMRVPLATLSVGAPSRLRCKISLVVCTKI